MGSLSCLRGLLHGGSFTVQHSVDPKCHVPSVTRASGKGKEEADLPAGQADASAQVHREAEVLARQSSCRGRVKSSFAGLGGQCDVYSNHPLMPGSGGRASTFLPRRPRSQAGAQCPPHTSWRLRACEAGGATWRKPGRDPLRPTARTRQENRKQKHGASVLSVSTGYPSHWIEGSPELGLGQDQPRNTGKRTERGGTNRDAIGSGRKMRACFSSRTSA